MTRDHEHFHFFRNKKIDAIWVMLILLALGTGLISIFVPVFLWQLGLPLWQIILFYFLDHLTFIIFALALLPLWRRLSDRSMMLASLPLYVVFYVGLGQLSGVGWLFYCLPAVHALSNLLFITGYHMSFSSAADAKHTGHEVGGTHAIATVAKLAAPLLGGFLITAIGFQGSFMVGALIMLASILPLLFLASHKLAPDLSARQITRTLLGSRLRSFNISGVGYAMSSVVDWFIWPIFLILVIGGIAEFGSVISAGLLAGAIITYITGAVADSRYRRKMFSSATWLASLIWFLRPLSITAPLAVGLHVGDRITSTSANVSWLSQYYRIAATYKNPGAFILGREILYKGTRVLFLPLLMLLAIWLPLGTFFIAAFVLAGLGNLLLLAANRQK